MRSRSLLVAVAAVSFATSVSAFTRTETREDCANRVPSRQPFFGDLHVHTRFSFDAAAGGSLDSCCPADPVRPVVQERAWTSPIWWR